jgi:hypothetical protein
LSLYEQVKEEDLTNVNFLVVASDGKADVSVVVKGPREFLSSITVITPALSLFCFANWNSNCLTLW